MLEVGRGEELFRRAGALLNGHFFLQSGRCGLDYVAKDLLRENDDEAMREICRSIADDFAECGIEVVVGPESGAVKYAEYVARFLSELLPTSKDVVAIRAKKCLDGDGGKGFYLEDDDIKFIAGKRTLVVEDVFTTGESAAKVVAMIKLHNADVYGVGGVWNRGGVTAKDLGVNIFISQINQQYPTFMQGEDTCPACREKIPYNMTFGHAKKLIGENPLAIEPAE